ncbi:MAG TPA: hypothetical protein PLM56_10410 [Cyclobacteriaceae bacterium]|jgi:bacterioferritin-associated ferredoxin|nr:hypothetical protein [Cytophagales bacterium]HRE68347.1 hypothetical protein [Cyclobacteriaceae bacterium]HRF33903.1 hypothetical protein [Cyclobacteriaceae bacterium]
MNQRCCHRWILTLITIMELCSCKHTKEPAINTYITKLGIPQVYKLYLIIPQNACGSCVESTLEIIRKENKNLSVCLIVLADNMRLAKYQFGDILKERTFYDSSYLYHQVEISIDYPTYFLMDKSFQVIKEGSVSAKNKKQQIDQLKLIISSEL